jgi:hypothetical protein
MAFNDFEKKRYEKIISEFLERRRPHPSIRNQLDLSFRIKNQSVEIFEVRPAFQAPEEKVQHPVAKATYVRTQDAWRVFWRRADLKWHSYPPTPEVKSLYDFVTLVDQDKHCCFWG